MSKASADPNEIRRFANELKKFNTDLMDQSKALYHRYSKLGDSWQDGEYMKFSDSFESILKDIGRFSEASSQMVPMLLRKAERLDEYLKQR